MQKLTGRVGDNIEIYIATRGRVYLRHMRRKRGFGGSAISRRIGFLYIHAERNACRCDIFLQRYAYRNP